MVLTFEMCRPRKMVPLVKVAGWLAIINSSFGS
jgi:hypothetical protein